CPPSADGCALSQGDDVITKATNWTLVNDRHPQIRYSQNSVLAIGESSAIRTIGTPRIHHAARRRGRSMAACRARPAESAGHRFHRNDLAVGVAPADRGIRAAAER